MTAAQGIEKLGFRRWYERQLIEGHVYFVTCFLCLIVLAACLEQFDFHGAWDQQVWFVVLIVGSGILCFKSLGWYNFLLGRAETLGAQSSCAQCSVYGVLQVVDAGQADPEVQGAADNSWIRVRCKKCGHEWRMDNV
jgi:hypothetical protein